jgi:hypothetical protein
MKRLKFSMSVSISQSAVCSAPVLTFIWHFVFGAVKCDWLLILALQTTFNVHYFFYVVLELDTNSLPYTAAMMIITIKNTRKRFKNKTDDLNVNSPSLVSQKFYNYHQDYIEKVMYIKRSCEGQIFSTNPPRQK